MKTVMVVDDEESVLRLVTLNNIGRYKLLLSRSGEEAIHMAREERPHLLFLDVMMPGRDGYRVCQELKSDPITKDIPVVMLTALAQQADRLRALGAGADDFFVKPFSPTMLLQKVEQILNRE
jgi:CheY-like chemotaxis protein